MTTGELLGEYAALINGHGVESKEANEFLEMHKFNDEFFDLAQLSKKLKVALTAPVSGQFCNN